MPRYTSLTLLGPHQAQRRVIEEHADGGYDDRMVPCSGWSVFADCDNYSAEEVAEIVAAPDGSLEMWRDGDMVEIPNVRAGFYSLAASISVEAFVRNLAGEV